MSRVSNKIIPGEVTRQVKYRTGVVPRLPKDPLDNVIEIDEAIPTNPFGSGTSEEEDKRGGTKDPHSAEGLRP